MKATRRRNRGEGARYVYGGWVLLDGDAGRGAAPVEDVWRLTWAHAVLAAVAFALICAGVSQDVHRLEAKRDAGTHAAAVTR